MARGRFISKTLGSSRKFETLGRIGGSKLGDFSQTLYMLLVTHADDFGRLPGDSFTAKFRCFPTSRHPLDDFEKALEAMVNAGLITRYTANGSTIAEIVNFDGHQIGLHKRSKSYYPASNGNLGSLDASEERVEAKFAASLKSGEIRISNFNIVSVERQLRIGNSYIDIVATTSENLKIIVEVKRSPVTLAAVEQVLKYAELVSPSLPLVVGHGLAANLPIPRSDVAVIVYDDSLSFSMVSGNVKSHSVTLHFVPAQQEYKQEYKQEQEVNTTTMLKSASPPHKKPAHDVSEPVMDFPCVGRTSTWHLTQAKLAEYSGTYPGMDVARECREARQWCIDNTRSRKAAAGMSRFLSGWLQKSANESRKPNGKHRDPARSVSDEQCICCKSPFNRDAVLGFLRQSCSCQPMQWCESHLKCRNCCGCAEVIPMKGGQEKAYTRKG